MSEVVKGILRAVSSGLQIPTIIILILLILLTILMLGSFFAELFTERRTLKMNIPKLVDQLQGKSTSEMKTVIEKSTLLTRQKTAAQELISRVKYPDDTREALARQLLADEEMRYAKITKITDLVARVAPMFGLMGTLIPLGPGLIALGQGDTKTLSDSMLIAFDTTVAGLISGAVSYVISGLRKGWYEQYMIGLETIMETILDVQNTERRKAAQQMKKQGTEAQAPASTTHPQGQINQRPQTGQGAQAPTRSQAQGKPQSPASAQAASAAKSQMQSAPAHQSYAPPQAQARPAQAQGMKVAASYDPAPGQQLSRDTQTLSRANLQKAQQQMTQVDQQTVVNENLQAEIRAAEEAMRKAEAEAKMATQSLEGHTGSLEELLEDFSEYDGRL